MRICVHGFGNVGSALAKLWVNSGHEVSVGLRPDSKHRATAQQMGVEVVDPAAGAQKADVNVLALPWSSVEGALRSFGSLHGKILIDATNPLDGDLAVVKPPAGSGGLQVAEWASGAKVVKAFNTIGAILYGNAMFDVLYCGDDTSALETVKQLIVDTKMTPQFVGPLKNAGYLENIAGLWIDLAVNSRVNGSFGFNLVKQQ